MRIRWIILVFLLATIQGCYLAKQGKGQLEIWYHQKPLEEAIGAEPDTDFQSLLSEVPKIKQFAVSQLALDDSDSYADYFATSEKGIAYVVTACPKEKLAPYQWWFPIIGSVPYKGFFDQRDALALENKLKEEGYDTWVFIAPAYSTLGWFDDPITTPMLNAGRFYLADTIIHELTHQKVFVDNHVEFNEQLASFVGVTGAFEYFQSSGTLNEHQLDQIVLQRENMTEINNLVKASIPLLNQIYESDLLPERKLEERQEVFDQLTAEIVTRFPNGDKKRWRFNNARIAQYVRYQPDAPEIERLWEASDGDWPLFWSLVEHYVEETF